MPSCTHSISHRSVSHSQCHPAHTAFHTGLYHTVNAILHTQHFTQVFITHSMPSCTHSISHRSVSHSQCHPAHTAFHTGLYHTVNAVLHRQSISHRSVSHSQCRPAQTEHFTQVCITQSMPSCTDRAFHTGLYHPLNAVLHRQSISHRSVSHSQCRPAQTEHFTQVCITQSMPSCTDRAFHTGLYHTVNAVLHRQSISHRSVSHSQCRPAQTEHFTQVCITQSMPSCTDRAFHTGLYHTVNAVLHRQSISHRSVSHSQCRPAQTEHFTQVCITHSTVTSTTHTSTTQTENSSRRSLPPTQCRPAQTEHFTQVCVTYSMPSCTEHFTHVCITHSMPSCTDTAFDAGLYHPLNAVLHRQSISCRSLSPTHCYPAQQAVPSLAQHRPSISHTSLSPTQCQPVQQAVLSLAQHRQSISHMSLSPTQCQPAQ